MSDLQQSSSTYGKDIRAIRIFFNAILAGTIMFSLIALSLNMMKQTISPFKDPENVILWVAIAMGLTCYAVARTGFNKSIAGAKDSLISLPDKLNQYRTALIRYVALCEMPALFGIILFFITGNYFMFIVTAIMIIAMVAKAPTRQRVINDLALDWQQQGQLD